MSANDQLGDANPGWVDLSRQAQAFLSDWESANRRRTLEPLRPERHPLDLTTNDYLGLRHDLFFQAQVRQAIGDLPVGSGASRLLGGEFPIFRQLEHEFAAFKGAPDALYFPSGYAANEACVASLARFGGRLFSDSLNHASLIDGVRLSRLERQQRVIFPHNDLETLESLLEGSDAPHNLIVTESLFSMDGDRADLDALFALAQRYRGILVIDEAHAIGCCGLGGVGFSASLPQDQIITINTCGKALGVQGALVCGPAWLRDLLINTGRPFIFSTGPSPWLAAALRVAIALMPGFEQRRQWLASMALHLKEHLHSLGFDTGETVSHIIPILCGSDARALAVAQTLNSHGIRVKAIRPPTVPEGASRIRLSLHAGINPDEFDLLCRAFKGVTL